jgi:hypothetical protein
MDAKITRLLDAVSRVPDSPPEDLAAFLCSLPDAGTLPTPWETWTLFSLVLHRDRQYWVKEIIHTRLSGNSAALGAIGSLGHPDGVSQSGSVAGLPEWEYYFHGRGCCLTHQVTGEDIDVDFWDDSAEYFDAYFYTKYLESLRDPAPPEQRLLELHRSVRSVNPGIAFLFAAGALSPLTGRDSHPLRITDEVLVHVDRIKRFCLAWADPTKRIWLGGLVGDWIAAHESAAGLLQVQRITELRAARCRSIRSAQLRQVQGFSAADSLFGLAELGVADERLEAVFRGVADGTVSAALEIVAQQNDPRWCPHIHALFQRLDSHGLGARSRTCSSVHSQGSEPWKLPTTNTKRPMPERRCWRLAARTLSRRCSRGRKRTRTRPKLAIPWRSMVGESALFTRWTNIYFEKGLLGSATKCSSSTNEWRRSRACCRRSQLFESGNR